MSEEQLMHIAEPLVDFAIDKYFEGNKTHFQFLLAGIGNYKLEAFREAGHNYYAVLKTIYKYQNEHPEIEVDKILFNSLKGLTSITIKRDNFEFLLEVLDAQLNYQQEGISPFIIECDEILENMYSKIRNNMNVHIEHLRYQV